MYNITTKRRNPVSLPGFEAKNRFWHPQMMSACESQTDNITKIAANPLISAKTHLHDVIIRRCPANNIT